MVFCNHSYRNGLSGANDFAKGFKELLFQEDIQSPVDVVCDPGAKRGRRRRTEFPSSGSNQTTSSDDSDTDEDDVLVKKTKSVLRKDVSGVVPICKARQMQKTDSVKTLAVLGTADALPQHGCGMEDARAVALLLQIGNIRDHLGNYVPYEKVDAKERKRLGIPDSLNPDDLRNGAQNWLLGNLTYLASVGTVAPDIQPVGFKALAQHPKRFLTRDHCIALMGINDFDELAFLTHARDGVISREDYRVALGHVISPSERHLLLLSMKHLLGNYYFLSVSYKEFVSWRGFDYPCRVQTE